jgi:hypothetical protein
VVNILNEFASCPDFVTTGGNLRSFWRSGVVLFMRQIARYMGVVFILMAMFGPWLDSAGARSSLDDAIDIAIELSDLESKGRASALYRHLHSDAKAIIPESAVVGWYESDFFPLQPQPISEIVSAQFVDWTWGVTGQTYMNTAEISFVQPFGSGSSTTYQQETVRLVEDEGEWRWFFGRSAEFVNEQIARFPDDSVRTASRSTDRRTGQSTQRSSSDTGSRRSQRSSSGCTLVELYPGYPMSRGVVTGMLANWGGLGDWACLEDLERMNPGFDIEAEDRANVAAARELGINGNPEDWLWENWLQIEAERGLPLQCYSCVMSTTGIMPLTTTVQVDPTDPRVIAGLWNGWESYTYRALAFIAYQGHIPNAPELLEAIAAILENESQPGRTYFTVPDAARHALAFGGYTFVPPTANPLDQEFIIVHAFVAPSRYVPPPIMSAQISLLNEGTANWRADRLRGETRSLREYLVDFYASKGIEY